MRFLRSTPFFEKETSFVFQERGRMGNFIENATDKVKEKVRKFGENNPKLKEGYEKIFRKQARKAVVSSMQSDKQYEKEAIEELGINNTKNLTEAQKIAVQKEAHKSISNRNMIAVLLYAKTGKMREGKNFATFKKEELDYHFGKQSFWETVASGASRLFDGVDDDWLEAVQKTKEFNWFQQTISRVKMNGGEMSPEDQKKYEKYQQKFIQKFLPELSPSEVPTFMHIMSEQVLGYELKQNDKVVERLGQSEADESIDELTEDIFEIVEKYGSEELKAFVKSHEEEYVKIAFSGAGGAEIQWSEVRLSVLESVVAEDSPEIEKPAQQISLQMQALGPEIDIFNTRLDSNGNYQIFFNQNETGIGNHSYVVGISPNGQAYIEDEYSDKVPFDPNNPEGFKTGHKILRYRQIARFASERANELDNFSEFMTPEMTGKFVRSFEAYNRSFKDPEKVFLEFCQNVVDKEPAKTMGLGRYFRDEFFGNSTYLNRDKLLKLETQFVSSEEEKGDDRGVIQEMLA